MLPFTADHDLCVMPPGWILQTQQRPAECVTKEYHCSSGGGGFLHTQFPSGKGFGQNDFEPDERRMEVVDISLDE
jgi:hypothetical protein